MSSTRTTVRAARAWIDGALRPADLTVADGVIVAVDDPSPERTPDVLVADDAVLLPGLVDSHVHVNDPGRTEWEGFPSATRAAAAGGVTTIIDMPLNSLPPTTTPDALAVKRRTAAGAAHIDVGFWGGAVPDNLGSLAALHDEGVFGFKCFLSPSGVDEFPHLDLDQLDRAMVEVAAIGSRLIVHAEDPTLLDPPGALGRGYRAFLDSRPPASEAAAIAAVIDAARRTGATVHILHLSDATALPLIAQAKADGVALTVETCPHYLTLIAEDIPDGASEFKCCPPIREARNRDLLWDGIRGGLIDAIVSDHSPSTAELKTAGDGDFGLAWGGISGLQVGLSAVWTEALTRGIPLEVLLPLFASGPARVAGLAGVGEIAVGAPAHLTEFAPAERFAVRAAELWHRNPITAYDGRDLIGRIRRTWLRGVLIHDITDIHAEDAGATRPAAASGRLLTAREISA
ncbi:MAG: allantoinase AllB [Microbacterium sp.]